ncbi:MAG: LysR family transcriptional regulator [Burkholderiales bacterium]|nr:LysR family transcriptional regulator [Burkholderiales bacterium]
MRSKFIDLNALQMFVAVAEERSVSAAAERVGNSQSAVSQSIRQLEEDLGAVLLDRSHRPLHLTAAGLTLLNRARILLSDSAQMRSEVQEASRGIAPEVTIGLVDSFAATCGPAFIKRMLEKTVRLAVRSGLTPYHGEKLFAREFDIAVTSDTFEGLERVGHRRIYSERFIILTPRGSGVHHINRESLQRLASSTPLIRFNPKSHLGSQVETQLRRTGIRALSRLEVDTADTVVATVAAGLGWALTTPTCLVQGQQYAASVQVHLLSDIHGGRSLYLLHREGEHEKLFETCYAAALGSVEDTLMPALKRLAPHAADHIELATASDE